ncbi:phage integrase Arm DNA-binding domain-containing protein [Shewanella frigidimarina]|uniref:phage integrase Arm DNA-binding domain-containing protein n=1 Tax=Shewanella frigidimarina TaxID=56812 RepID=UPI003D7C0BAC
MGRKRKHENSDLPKGLYAKNKKNNTYFEFKNPFYGIKGLLKSNIKTLSLGADKKIAIQRHQGLIKACENYSAASDADLNVKSDNTENNEHITFAKNAGFTKPNYITVLPDAVTYIGALVEKMISDIEKKSTLSKKTQDQYKYSLNKIRKKWGPLQIEYLNTANIQTHLEEYIDKGNLNTAKKFKSVYKQLLEFGKRNGLIEIKAGVIEATDTPRFETKRSRLSSVTFKEVHDEIYKENIPNALTLELGVITASRPQDLTLVKKHKNDDWDFQAKEFIESTGEQREYLKQNNLIPSPYIDEKNRCLVILCQKTVNIIKISFDQYSPTLNKTLGELIDQIKIICTVPTSEFLIHQIKNHGPLKLGASIKPITLSRMFTKHIKRLNKSWLKGSHPTLYEVRSLAMRDAQEVECSAKNIPNTTVSENNSTITEAVNLKQNISKAIDLGGHCRKSKMAKDIYMQPRDLFHQQLNNVLKQSSYS